MNPALLTDAELSSLFPNLHPDSDTNTSPPAITYNCFAHAAGRDDTWWEPASGPGYFWPPGAPMDYTTSSVIRAYEEIGFALCQSADLEIGYEKVAVYAESGEGTHAARQLPNGLWTSKLGNHQDIQHASPESVAGDEYGQVVAILKRPLATPVP